MAAAGPYPVSHSHHLADLLTDADRLATLVAGAPPAHRSALAESRRVDAAKATLVLDAVPAEEIPDPATAVRTVTAAGPGRVAPDTLATGTWLDAMRVLDQPHDATVHALELLGALEGLAAGDLAEPLSTDLSATLAELHRRLTRGLVAQPGIPRTRNQAVVDGGTGRVIYFPADPATCARDVALLGAWIATDGSREPALVTSGVLHLELLRLHPFEVASGRLARTAARLMLQARRLDPDGLAAPEVWLARDALGYHEEVAQTAHRRNLTIWCERWGEAVTDGLRAAARDLAVVRTSPSDRAEWFVEAQGGADFTVADYRSGADVPPQTARNDLRLLLDAGRIDRVPGTRGLRLRPVPG